MAETNEEMATTEEQPKARGEINGEPMYVEDTNGFKKEDVIETEGNLPTDDATVIGVEKTEPDEDTDVSTEEIVNNSISKEEVDKIDAEAKEYLDKYTKEAEIDWDKVDFEDEAKMFPKVSKEELDVFCAISEGFIDRDVVETYLRIAHNDIENYLEMKELVESGQATQDDKEYYDSLSKSKENSRILLASIQQDGRKLDKEFKESHIAEDIFKVVSLKAISDYIVRKYRLSNSWRPSTDERHSIDNTNTIREDLIKNMYVAPLFKNIIERDVIKAEVDLKFNMFGPKFYNDHLSDFVNAIRTYIKHGGLDFDKLTIEKVLTADFKAFEFMRIPMVWAVKNYNESISVIKDWEMTPEDEEKLRSIVNPNGINDDNLKELSASIDDGINTIMNTNTIDKMLSMALHIIKTDQFAKELNVTNDEDWCNNELILTRIAELIPENVTTSNFTTWAKIYKCLQKYNRFYMFYNLKNYLASEEFDSDKKRVNSFNTLCGLVEDYYLFMIGELVYCLDSFIRDAGYSKDVQSVMFSTMLSNLMCQHELGYRQKLILDGEEKNNSGEGLYKVAEERLKDKYAYVVGSKEDDILLKDADLAETRKMYVKDCNEMVKFITNQLKEIATKSDDVIAACEKQETTFVASKKKSKKKRR